jgi:transposase-like protein
MAAYERPVRFGGPGKTVYVDEVYLKHVVGKRGGRLPTIVLGIMCDGFVLTGIIPDRKGKTLTDAIQARVMPHSKIITDDWGGYQKLSSLGFQHQTINHSSGHFFDFDGRSTCEIDSYWATLKRSLRLYHQVGSQNLWLYLAEIEFRYNHRFANCSPFDELTRHWPDLEAQDMQNLTRRYDWRTDNRS